MVDPGWAAMAEVVLWLKIDGFILLVKCDALHGRRVCAVARQQEGRGAPGPRRSYEIRGLVLVQRVLVTADLPVLKGRLHASVHKVQIRNRYSVLIPHCEKLLPWLAVQYCIQARTQLLSVRAECDAAAKRVHVACVCACVERERERDACACVGACTGKGESMGEGEGEGVGEGEGEGEGESACLWAGASARARGRGREGEGERGRE